MAKVMELRYIMQACSAKTVTTVAVVNKSDAEHYGGGITYGDKTKKLLVHCGLYHLEVDRRKSIRAEIFVKTLPVNGIVSRGFLNGTAHRS